MAFNGTPGEWVIVPYGDGDSLVIHQAGTENRVCFMATGQKLSITEANANLITASKGLLEALQAILPGKLCGESWSLPDDESVQIMVTFGDLKAARKAIAAATGEAK